MLRWVRTGQGFASLISPACRITNPSWLPLTPTTYPKNTSPPPTTPLTSTRPHPSLPAHMSPSTRTRHSVSGTPSPSPRPSSSYLASRRKIDRHIMPFMCSTFQRYLPVTSLMPFPRSHVPVCPLFCSHPHLSHPPKDHFHGQDHPRRSSRPRHRVRPISALTSHPQTRLARPGAHLNTTQFNWLGTIFYFSYLLFQYPQNLALQRFPVGKWMRYCSSSPIPPR
jgi:hypothetical protein